jgi:fibronectin type 3 domain-containing protein
VSISSGFNGMNFSAAGSNTPPDTNAAAGPTAVVEILNNALAFYDRSGNSLAAVQPLATFFNTSNLQSDVRVYYDDAAHRFVISTLDIDTTNNREWLDVGFSNDANPLDGWQTRKIELTESGAQVQVPGNAGSVLWGDYDNLGANANAYVWTVNMFTFPVSATSAFDHVQVLAVDKSAVMDSTHDNHIDLQGWNGSQIINENLAPVKMHGATATDPMVFVEETTYATTTNSIRILKAPDILHATASSFQAFDVQVPTYSYNLVPDAQHPWNSGDGTANAVQRGSTDLIQTNDTRILSAAWVRDSQGVEHLVASQDVGSTLADARWYEFNTSGTPSLIQSGDIKPGNGVATYFPSIDISPNLNIGVSYLESSATEYLSTYDTGRANTDTPGTLQPAVLAQAGTVTYDFPDGSPHRAGDFSSVAEDFDASGNPTNTFWAANEYTYDLIPGFGLGSWATWISHFQVTPVIVPLFNANVNFTNSTTDTFPGYVNDTGSAYPNTSGGLTFGWNQNNSANAFDRNTTTAPDERFDSFGAMQAASNPNASWEIQVPNGTYSVHIVAGDPTAINSVYEIAVNGVLAVNGTPTTSSDWVSGTVTVSVSNSLITVTNAAGASNNKIDFIDITQVPAIPTQLIATPGEQQVTLTWTDNQTSPTFNIYRGTSPGGEGATPIATGVTTTSFTDTGLTDGTTYYYKVIAVNNGVTSALSGEASATPRIQPPPGLTASPGNTRVSLSWSPAPGAVSYNVYRGTSSGGEGPTPIATGVTGTSFTDTGLTDGTTYFYQVTSVHAAGESLPSGEVSATPIPPPSAPTGVVATAGHTAIALNWTPAATATTYNVYRGTTPGGEGATPIATGLTTTSFTDTSLTDGTTYYYRITAVNAGGESGQSAEVSATSQFLILAIDAGGGAVAPFAADTGFSGNTLTYATSSPIDASGVFQPPPQSVYQTMRYANPPGFSYNLTGLTPGATYTVRLDFVEPTLFGVGQRVFNVTLNGAAFLTNFDIYATAGNDGNTAVAKTGTTTADATGQISISFTSVVQDPLVCAIQVLAPTPVAPPPAPTNLVATPSLGQVGLTWTAVTGASSYNVYRGTSPGGEGATPVATGVTAPTFTDVGVTPGTTYYYQVSAVNAGGEGPRSSERSATPQGLPPNRVLAIDAGGGVVGPFAADTDFVGNTLTYATTSPIDTTGVFQPPPQNVLQTMRYSNPPGFGYTLTGLTPGAAYTVRLDFIEPTLFGVGQRVFNVTLNGGAFLTNFDIYAAAGDVGNRAVAETATATADTSGQISVGFTSVVQDPLVCAIEVFSNTPIAAPPAPTNLVAAPNVGQVGLTWTAVAGASSYNVYRGTSPGGEGATALATGVTTASFLDTGATPGTTYYYQVSAVNLGGEGARSAERSATPQGLPPVRVLAIDAGGGAVGPFVSDTDFVGSTLTYATSSPIDTSGVFQPPPQSVYQTMRYSAPPGFGYNLTGLTPGGTYTVRLHFVEPTLFGVGQRVFNVTLNGAAFLTNFDIYAAAGNVGNRAVAETGTATADANGVISVGFTSVVQDPLVCAIEVFSTTPVVAPPAPTNLTATVNVGQVGLSWTAVAGASTYNVYRGTSPGGEGATALATGVTTPSFLDLGATPGTTYYYQVSAVNSGGEGARSSEQSSSATVSRVLAIDAGGGAVGSFVADTDFVGNSLTYATTSLIDSSGVFQAPPQSVLQTMRYNSPPGFGYTLTGLTPGAAYTVRLDFIEPTLFGAGQRVFNVTLNGAAFLTNFDIYAAAGFAGNRAVARTGTATADASGQISISFTSVVQDPLVCAIEVFSTTPITPPPAPTNLAPTVNLGQVGLSWTAVAGASSYNIYRGTSPGGEGATPIATGVTGTLFSDNHATAGTTYYYQVSAVNLGGEGARSSEQTSSATFTTVQAIDAGGGAVGSFAADSGFSGNTLTYTDGSPIDTSGVFQPPPQSVMQTMRYTNAPSFSYTLSGLTPGATYTIRLDFVEPTLFGVGQRVFNVGINGAAFLTNFDIYAAAGNAGNRAVAEVTTATANANGQITISFTSVVQDPLVCAIEVFSATP